MSRYVNKHKKLILLIVDLTIIVCSYFLAETLKENFVLTDEIRIKLINTILISCFIYGIMFSVFRVYSHIIVFASAKEYIICAMASMVSFMTVFVFEIISKFNILDAQSCFLAMMFIIFGTIGYRVLYRDYYINKVLKLEKVNKEENKNVIIIGAGFAGNEVVKTILKGMRHKYNIIGIIDDDENKKNHAISSVKILGNRHKIKEVVKEKRVDLIFFVISAIDNENRKEILNICQETGVKVRILPSIHDIIKNKKLIDNFRDVEIEDLLGREPAVLDNENISVYIKDKNVMVTGAGSIGSELCRQIMKFEPKKLIIIDNYENNLYDIETELKQQYPTLEIIAIIANIREGNRLDEIFKKYLPSIVFHAAAHKHVPLMEESPVEAIKNNIFGTYNVVECSDKYNVNKFVLISTDKAVNPTNIMGATKRFCEMIIQSKSKESKTEFVAVRFGNVLGSNGSVIPLFKKQIAKGGPVTLTHKEITRFFMTIPEAVQLIMQAGAYAKGGEIFVLDMGEPVKIYDLAVKLIKLSGLEPNVDMKIDITGLRPGEKLYEELLMAEEGLTETQNRKIRIAKPMEINRLELQENLKKLKMATEYSYTNNEIKEIMRQAVPTYADAEKYNDVKKKENVIEVEEGTTIEMKELEELPVAVSV